MKHSRQKEKQQTIQYNSCITALYADENGNICEADGLQALGRIGEAHVPLATEDLIPLPDSADLMFLPAHYAVGQKGDGSLKILGGMAVAAILPQGYTRTHLPGFYREDGAAPLPLYGYTAVAVYRGELHAAAIYTDENEKWDPENYNGRELKKLVRRVMKELPNNRIVQQVGSCSLNYHCLTAQNLFYRRWECGVPTSPVCNANCLGCISLQSSECCPSPQQRITFRPTPEEIAEVGIYHLSIAPDGIISFGQGCEGEPSLAADCIADGIRKIRAATTRGQINMNSNAGFPDGMKKIVDAGLDSLRVSMISARDISYSVYYRASYDLDAVKTSIRYALAHDVYVSINLLYFPGFNDRTEELAAWQDFFHTLPVQMIQMRNLNIDPTLFLHTMPPEQGAPIGTRKFMNILRSEFPQLVMGSFSHYVTQ